jgi:hypothetical protein
MSTFATKAGARIAPVQVARPSLRTIEEMAENTIEGCVGETFGAAVAHIQARRAAETRVRSAMLRIAADETRHAELTWKLECPVRARPRPSLNNYARPLGHRARKQT